MAVHHDHTLPQRKGLQGLPISRMPSQPVLPLPSMPRPPDRQLLSYLAAYDPHINNLMLALREIFLEEAPDAIESVVKSYAVAIGFSFTGKPLKDGFCHAVAYNTHVNLGFNRGASCLTLMAC